MTKVEKELVRNIRVSFMNADQRTIEETQRAYASRGAWLHAWALQTLLNDK